MTEEHRRMPSFADEDLVDLRSYRTVEEGETELIELAPGETSLSFLQRVYRSVKQPMSRRMRAAIEALPHETPRLGAIATASMTGHDFASMLERAIERSGKRPEVKQIESRVIDLTPANGGSEDAKHGQRRF